jgi:hypothetical protein
LNGVIEGGNAPIGLVYGWGLVGSALACLAAGAAIFGEEELSILRARAVSFRVPVALADLGWTLLCQGDAAGAVKRFDECLSLLKDRASREPAAAMVGVVLCLLGLAGIAIVDGKPTRAARLLAAADKFIIAFDGEWWTVEQADYERYLAAARAKLDEAAFIAAWATGRAMTMEQAIAYALEEADT